MGKWNSSKDLGFEEVFVNSSTPEVRIETLPGEVSCPECFRPYQEDKGILNQNSGEKICPACYRRHLAAIEED